MPEVTTCTAIQNLNDTLGFPYSNKAAFGDADFVCEFNYGGASSQATASMAALIWSTNTAYTIEQVVQKMIASSDYPNRVVHFGHGRVNMKKISNNTLG